MDYTFPLHLHNFSVWTSARAVQRGFTTTTNIKIAIENTSLPTVVESNELKNSEDFDTFHRECCNQIIQNFKTHDVPNVSYGRAAKIVAIYLKTSVIIKNSGQGILSKIAHPPIDNILLINLDMNYKELGLSGIKWTQLTEDKYFELIEKLRNIPVEYFWELEKYWNPVQK